MQRTIGLLRSMQPRRVMERFILYVLIVNFSILFMFPFLWTVSSSLKTPIELIEYPPRVLPASPNWSSYYEAWTSVMFGRFFLNSMIVTSLSVVGTVVSSFIGGYGFARFRFPGRSALFTLCLSTMMLPPQVTIIPLFVVFRSLGWIDTWYPLVVPNFFGAAFTIFLARQFIMTLPLDLDEAALIDGASRLGILRRIILPNSGPVLATAAIFAFIGNWNAFLQPLIFLNDARKFTIPLGLWYLKQQPGVPGLPKDNLLMAGSVMATAPIVLLFFVAQRYFVQGIAMSGIKG